MECINIISKEAITMIPNWQVFIIAGIAISALCSTFIYWIVVKDANKVLRYVMRVGLGAIIFEIIALCICSAFFKVPTGRYKYQATIDKDKITVYQYEEFIEEHHPTIKDGIYYWEE